MAHPKRKMKIIWQELEFAFENHDPLLLHYLDLDTGEIVFTNDEQRRLLEDVHQKYGNLETGEVDWSKVLPELDIQDWEKEELLLTDRVEAGFSTRFIAIPQRESYVGYNDMTAFIETVQNPRLQARLEGAVHGKGAFRRFKDVLLNFPEERQYWFTFQSERIHQWALDWLEEEGIEPV